MREGSSRRFDEIRASLRTAAVLGILHGLLLLGTPSTRAESLAEPGVPDYGSYAEVLSGWVDEQGMVDYRRLQADRSRLDRFTRSLEALEVREFETWNSTDRLAFWINAYNALTLQAIIDNYPIEPGVLRSLVHPRNSIRQIPGVWDRLRFPVLGRELSLDEIEHDIIRGKFREPRIHFALVCAAKGCPPLRQQPYQGSKLDDQLDDQVRRFLSNAEKFRIDRERNRVYLSPLFEWYQNDFSNAGNSSRYPGAVGAIPFIRSFLTTPERQYLDEGNYTIEYLDYDWSLNEQ